MSIQYHMIFEPSEILILKQAVSDPASLKSGLLYLSYVIFIAAGFVWIENKMLEEEYKRDHVKWWTKFIREQMKFKKRSCYENKEEKTQT